MSTLARRDNSVQLQTGTALGVAASYKVNVLPVGAQVVSVASLTITVRAGHGFVAGDKWIANTTASTFTAAKAVASVTATEVVMGSGWVDPGLVAGDVLLNLGPDTSTTASTPAYDGSPVKIYSDMAGAGSAITRSEVTTGSDGQYTYYAWATGQWEIIRTSAGTPVDYLAGVGSGGRTGELNACDYGAVPDCNLSTGVGTDNYKRLQAALTAAGGVGASVRVPGALLGYYYKNGLSIPSNVTLTGDGMGATILVPALVHTAANYAGSQAWNGDIVAPATNHVTIRDLTLNQRILLSPYNGIEFGFSSDGTEPSDFMVENVEILSHEAHHYGIFVRRGHHGIIRGCRIDADFTTGNTDYDAIDILGGDDILVEGNRVTNVGVGMAAFVDSTTTNSSNKSIRFVNNHIDTAYEGIALYSDVASAVVQTLTECKVIGNTIRNTRFVGILTQIINAGKVESLTISHNSIQDVVGDGIRLAAQDATGIWADVDVSSNIVERSTQDGSTTVAGIYGYYAYNFSFKNNHVRSPSKVGILVSACHDAEIEGNRIDMAGTNGIVLSTCDRIAVHDNGLVDWDATNGVQAGIGGTVNTYLSIYDNWFYRSSLLPAEPRCVYISGNYDQIGPNKTMYASGGTLAYQFADYGTNVRNTRVPGTVEALGFSGPLTGTQTETVVGTWTGAQTLQSAAGKGALSFTPTATTQSAYIAWYEGGGTRLGYIGNSTTDVACWLENSAGFTIIAGNNATWKRGYATESITIAAANNDSSANLLPANSLIDAVVARITTTISGTGVTVWSLADVTTANRFTADNATLTANTTDVGIKQWNPTNSDAAGPVQTAAAKVRVSVGGSGAWAGAVRVVVFYRQFVGPTS